MVYTEYKFTFLPSDPWQEIFMALIAEIPFESFEETENGLNAYILSEKDDEEFIKAQIKLLSEVKIDYKKNEIPQQNWNEEWEKNFHPIMVDNRCLIRAEFHESHPDVEHEIVIQPKMAFGTGHHETTFLIIQFLLDRNLSGLDVLDMGTGTGILAILAHQKGAQYIEAIDIDEWAYNNAVENVKRNNANVIVKQGGGELLGEKTFDLIIANINKNILIAQIPSYKKVLKSNGTLILSGLYDFDEADILSIATKNGLKFVDKKQKNNWIALCFQNQS